MELHLVITSNVPVHVHIATPLDDGVLNDVKGAIATLMQQQGTLMSVFTDLDAAITKYMADRDAADVAKDAAVADAVQKMKDAIANDVTDQATIATLNAHVAELEQTIADATATALADIAKLNPPSVPTVPADQPAEATDAAADPSQG